MKELELAALLCSKVCHDLISPVGALNNGLEVLSEETDEEMKGFALDLIGSSAEQAAAKLQFARLAFGAAGTAGAEIDLREAEAVARGFVKPLRHELNWQAPPATLPKDWVKLLLNLVLLVGEAAAKGGQFTIRAEPGDRPVVELTVEARRIRFAPELKAMLADPDGGGDITPRTVQPYITGLLAKALGARVTVDETESRLRILAAGVQPKRNRNFTAS
jgi:histidine phosphotransferase ChpT